MAEIQFVDDDLFEVEDSAPEPAPEPAPEAESESEMEVDGANEGVDEVETANDPEPDMEPEEVVTDQEDAQHTVYVDNRNCFRCSHLSTVLSGANFNGKILTVKPYTTCFWKNGNDNCPARNIRIAIGVNAVAFAKRLVEKEKAFDTEGQATLVNQLLKFDDATQAAVGVQVRFLRVKAMSDNLQKSGISLTREYLHDTGVREGFFKEGGPIPRWYQRYMDSLDVANAED